MKQISFDVKEDGQNVLTVKQQGMVFEKSLMPHEVMTLLSNLKNDDGKMFEGSEKRDIWVQLKDDTYMAVEIEKETNVSVEDLKTGSILLVEYNGEKRIAYYEDERNGYEKTEENMERAKLLGFYEGEDLGERVCVIPLDVREKEEERRLLRDFKYDNCFKKVLVDGEFGRYKIEAYQHTEKDKLVFKILENGVHKKDIRRYQENILKGDKNMQESLKMWRIMHEYLKSLGRKGLCSTRDIYRYVTIV